MLSAMPAAAPNLNHQPKLNEKKSHFSSHDSSLPLKREAES